MSAAVRVAVLDYGAANMVSITKALAAVGADVAVVSEPAGLAGVDAVVVPGVGAAGSAMSHLQERGLLEPLRDWVRAGKPCLGICLGYQVLFESSAEGDVATLGVLAGRTEELVDAPTLPHIGWNSVNAVRPHALFDGIADGLGQASPKSICFSVTPSMPPLWCVLPPQLQPAQPKPCAFPAGSDRKPAAPNGQPACWASPFWRAWRPLRRRPMKRSRGRA